MFASTSVSIEIPYDPRQFHCSSSGIVPLSDAGGNAGTLPNGALSKELSPILAYTTMNRGPWGITPRAVCGARGTEESTRAPKGVGRDSDNFERRRLWGGVVGGRDGKVPSAYSDAPTRAPESRVRIVYAANDAPGAWPQGAKGPAPPEGPRAYLQ